MCGGVGGCGAADADADAADAAGAGELRSSPAFWSYGIKKRPIVQKSQTNKKIHHQRTRAIEGSPPRNVPSFFFFFTEFDQVLTDYTGVDQLVTACSPQTSKKKPTKKTAFHHHRTNLHPSIHPSIRHPNASKSILKKKKNLTFYLDSPPKNSLTCFFFMGYENEWEKRGFPFDVERH